jgi:hypothetical protein
MAGLFFSVVPFGFYYFGVTEEIICSVSSGVLGIDIIGSLVHGIRKHQKIKASSDPDFVPGVRQLILVITVPVVAILALNAVGLGFERTFAAYLLGLIALLVGCCAMFVLLLRFVRKDA